MRDFINAISKDFFCHKQDKVHIGYIGNVMRILKKDCQLRIILIERIIKLIVRGGI